MNEIVHKALIESEEHWIRTLQLFNEERKSIENQFFWFDLHCSDWECPLCQISDEDCMITDFGVCPLCDDPEEPKKCCKEWWNAFEHAKTGTLEEEYFQSVIDRIQKEKTKMTQPKFDQSIMEILRQRKGLEEEDDPSMDEEISKYTPEEALKELCGWELGSSSWASWFLDRAERCGMKITRNS